MNASARARQIYPMRVVLRRTGLSPDRLRAWERRYGVVSPGRTGGRQRLYSEADVERLTLLRRATLYGHAISQVAELSNEELERLLAAIDLDTPGGVRDRFLFELIYSCGLRVSEAAELTLERIYKTEKFLRVLGKGGKERIVPVGQLALEWMERYLGQARPALTRGRRLSSLFVNHLGQPQTDYIVTSPLNPDSNDDGLPD